MADPNSSFTELSAVVNDHFMGKLRDAIFDSNVLLRKLRGKQKKIAGGYKIREDILFNDTADGAYGIYAVLPTDHVTDITAAQFDWRRYQQSIVLEEFDNLCASGKEALLNLLKSKIKAAELKLKHSIGTGIFSAAGSSDDTIDGLQIAFAKTGTYGGINKATYSWWQGQVDSTTTVLTLKSLMDQWRNCSIDEDSPDLLVTGDATLNVLENILDAGQRYVNVETASGGFKNVQFHGAPVVVDSHCPTTATIPDIFFANFDYLNLVTHRKRDFKFRDFERPINQDAIVGRIMWMGNLTCSNPRMQGWMKALAS